MQDLPALPTPPSSWSPSEIATFLVQVLAYFLTAFSVIIGVIAKKWIRDSEAREASLKDKIQTLEERIDLLTTQIAASAKTQASLETDNKHLTQRIADLQKNIRHP